MNKELSKHYIKSLKLIWKISSKLKKYIPADYFITNNEAIFEKINENENKLKDINIIYIISFLFFEAIEKLEDEKYDICAYHLKDLIVEKYWNKDMINNIIDDILELSLIFEKIDFLKWKISEKKQLKKIYKWYKNKEKNITKDEIKKINLLGLINWEENNDKK